MVVEDSSPKPNTVPETIIGVPRVITVSGWQPKFGAAAGLPMLMGALGSSKQSAPPLTGHLRLGASTVSPSSSPPHAPASAATLKTTHRRRGSERETANFMDNLQTVASGSSR